MADTTTIEWTGATWNPITGCTLVSEGCRNCYAAQLAATRLKNHRSREGLARLNADGVAKFTGEVRFNEDWLDQPLRWKKPRMIFACAHGDLFHESVPDVWIDKVFAAMALAPQHTFQVLTKRPERMRGYLTDTERRWRVAGACWDMVFDGYYNDKGLNRNPAWPVVEVADNDRDDDWSMARWPLPNVWLGVSVEDQATADDRIPILLDTPAAIRWLSAEPLLGLVDLGRIPSPVVVPEDVGYYHNALERGDMHYRDAVPDILTGRCITEATDGPMMERLDWVVVGGESGKQARPMHPDWARSLRDQCAEANVPYFFKQWGRHFPVGQVLPGHGTVHGCSAVSPGRMKLHYGGSRENWPDFAYEERGVPFTSTPDGRLFFNIGKTSAGRLLDGVTHDGMPATTTSPQAA